MTGQDLLEALQRLSEYDLTKTVYMEGCDCYNECGDVYVDGSEIDLNRSYNDPR